MNNLPKFEEEGFLAQSLKTPHALEKYEKLAIGAAIKKARQKSGVTQHALAKKLKTSQSVIARMENGKQNFTVRTLILIAIALEKKLTVRFH